MSETQSTPRRQGKRKNLAERLALDLRAQVIAGDLQPGDRLPTEHALAAAHKVSRTVVREAVAALRADGLVVSRQGSGAFVAEKSAENWSFGLLTFSPEKLSSIIEILEIRAALESEAAALAAERCSPAELAKIRECHEVVLASLEQDQSALEQDFALHLAIAESTHNRHFIEFFRFLGARTIPRGQAGIDAPRVYLERIHQEHADIVEAIAKRDAAQARLAMRLHLKGSQDRYARLAWPDSSNTIL